MIAAVIPARGGSQRIPGKNVREFCGQPIIKYVIDAAKASGVFDQVVVSTDCPKIADVARNCGADVPFMRPAELADNFTATAPVLRHAIKELSNSEHELEYVCGIYPTAPFVQPEHLRSGLATLRKTGAKVVIPVTTFDFTIFRGVGISSNGEMTLLWPELLKTWDEHETTRSNDLPEAYHDAGQFYWLHADRFAKNATLWGPETRPMVISRKFVVDIDTPEDWDVAELKQKALILNGVL